MKDIAEKIELASYTNTVTKEELTPKIFGEDVEKTKMMNVAGNMIIQYEKELDESSQIIKSYENYNGDDNIRNDVLGKVFVKNILKI